jgi:hypothetical protein
LLLTFAGQLISRIVATLASSSTQQKWERTRRAALAVTIATQREGGLWALPSSKTDMDRRVAKTGSQTDRIRSEESFGFPSISVTWSALTALAVNLGSPPRGELDNAIRAAEELRKENGAYGIRGPGWKAEDTILSSARHSAMALLAHLDFGEELRPRPTFEHMMETARWISEQALRSGGWAYRETLAIDDDLDPLSVAYALAALTEFASRYRANLDADFMHSAALAITAGYDRLISSSSDPYWTFEHVVAETQCADSLEVIRMVARATEGDVLRAARPTASADLKRRVTKMAQDVIGGGLPQTPRSKLPAFASSIGLLLTASELGMRLNDEVENIVTNYVFRQLSVRNIWESLTTWDWTVLARLAGRRCAANDSVGLSEVVGCSRRTRASSFAGRLTRQMLGPIPYPAQTAMLFALSRGNPGTVPRGRSALVYRALPGWARTILEQVPGAIVGYLLGLGANNLSWFGQEFEKLMRLLVR